MKTTNIKVNEQENANVSHLPQKEWLNSTEAADFLSISEASLRNMVTQRKIIPGKLGRRNRYRFSDLRNLICSQDFEVRHGN